MCNIKYTEAVQMIMGFCQAAEVLRRAGQQEPKNGLSACHYGHIFLTVSLVSGGEKENHVDGHDPRLYDLDISRAL